MNVEFEIKGWEHTVGEQCNSFRIETFEVDTTVKIDEYKMVLLDSSEREIDCVVSLSPGASEQTV